MTNINFNKKNKSTKILVTGGRGFIGSNLVIKLKEKGYVVFAPSSKYDLRDKKIADKLTKNINIVIHLAAHIGSLSYNENPANLFYDNTIMSLNLIDASLRAKINKFIGIGTIREYPITAKIPFKEEEMWNTSIQSWLKTSPKYFKSSVASYAFAKRLMLAQLQFYHEQYGFPYIHLILSNTYGPEMRLDTKRTGIADIINKMIIAKKKQSKTVEFWGSGKVKRDFIYIDDVIKAILFFIRQDIKKEVLNIGSGKAISMKKIINILAQICNYQNCVSWDKSKPEGDLIDLLDINKAKSFGFTATTPFKIGMEKTIKWYNFKN